MTTRQHCHRSCQKWSCSDNSKAVTGRNLAQAESKGVGSDRQCILFFRSTEESAYVDLDKSRFYKHLTMDKVTGPDAFVFQLNVISKRDLSVAHILIFLQEDTQVNIT